MKTDNQDNVLKEIDIHQLLNEIVASKWLVVGITALFFVCGIFIAIMSKPKYQTSAIIQMNKPNDYFKCE